MASFGFSCKSYNEHPWANFFSQHLIYLFFLKYDLETQDYLICYCGHLNVTGPHKLLGSGTIMRCGYVGVCVVLLEEVCHRRGGL